MTEGPVSLADLIQRHIDTTGETYAAIAERAGVSRGRISQIAGGDAGLPKRDTLLGLARALSLPPAVIQSAAAVSAGIGQPDGALTHADVIAARLPYLSANDLEVVGELVDVLIAKRSRG